MSHALSIKHFNNYWDVEKCFDDWITLEDVQFFWQGIHKLPERWKSYVTNDGAYFEWTIFLSCSNIKRVVFKKKLKIINLNIR